MKSSKPSKPTSLLLRILLTLFRISLAALLVNVTDNIWFENALFSFKNMSYLEVSTLLVLPDPAPATIKSGPEIQRTASF